MNAQKLYGTCTYRPNQCCIIHVLPAGRVLQLQKPLRLFLQLLLALFNNYIYCILLLITDDFIAVI